MWPTISNIDSKIAKKIKSYPTNLLKASELNAWVRVFSGAEKGGYKGLIMESNTNWKLFNAAGESGGSIYGNPQQSGTLGRDWEGKAVNVKEGRGLRPSPIITSLNSKEGKDQISRTCDFSITCFSLEQLEYMQSYFMEPGYSIGVEWGWNTRNGVSGLIPTGTVDGVLNGIADTTLNNGELSTKRLKTLGEYDIFLGFIVGSTISNDGENFKIDVRLRGAPSLPTYLQSHNGVKSDKVNVEIDVDKSEVGYSPMQLTDTTSPAKRRFMYMFNELPAIRQTESVKKLIEDASLIDFVNFDKVVADSIDNFINEKSWFRKRGTVTLKDIPFEINREKLFSENKYIRFGFAMRILNTIGEFDDYKIGNKSISFKINVDSSIIGAFPNIFSTKADKLIIPGKIPDFSVYYLTGENITQFPTGYLNQSPPINPVNFDIFPEFVKYVPLDTKIGGQKLKEKAGYFGYLKDLYINFDIFKNKIEQSQKNIKDVLLDILNEMSSAVNGFWNFQIIEMDNSNGDIEIKVIDENWIGENPEPNNIVEFAHIGSTSPFLNSNLDVSIPTEMAALIINKRLSMVSQPDIPNVSVDEKSLFNSKTDLFLPKVANAGTPASLESTGSLNSTQPDKTEYEMMVDKVNALIDPTKTITAYNKTTTYKDSNGNPLKSEDINGIVTYFRNVNSIRGVNDKRLTTLQRQKEKDDKNTIEQRLSTFMNKLDVVPNPQITTAIPIDEKTIKSLVPEKFTIFCFDDSDFFDKIRNNSFENKYEKSNTVKGLSHPLPIKYTFTILGNSGIRRGDTFNIDGIPKKYKESGLFQVTEIEHTLSDMKWTTTITGQYRQMQ
jgi:hypothetical protein